MNARLFAILTALLALPGTVYANDELRLLREEIARMREAYETRISALERRLTAAESTAGQAEAKAAAAQDAAGKLASASPAASTPAASARTAPTAAAFNPEVSLILAGTYNKQSHDPRNYNDENAQNPRNYHIHGFVPTLGEVAPPKKGFGLGESELVFSANVDPTWRGKLVAALAPENSVSVEEAFIQSSGLDHGLTLKAGRFLSGVGYLNEQHAHAWDFADAPLAYKVFFANQLKSDGIQLKWIAPTDLYVEVGGETASGGSFPSTDRNKSGAALATLFAHAGGDLGIAQSWRAGLSTVSTSPRDREWRDVDSTGTAVQNRFSGKSTTWIVDGVWKWAPGGNTRERALTVQGEYFRRREDGQLTYDFANASRGAATGSYTSSQSGGYGQVVYKFRPQWRVGYRYDALDAGTLNNGLVAAGTRAAGDFPLLSAHKPKRHTLMMDYETSEFARFRVQLARDDVRYDFVNRQTLYDTQLTLQYVVSLGAHGAHRY